MGANVGICVGLGETVSAFRIGANVGEVSSTGSSPAGAFVSSTGTLPVGASVPSTGSSPAGAFVSSTGTSPVGASVSSTGSSPAGASVSAFMTGIKPSGVSKLYHDSDTGMLNVGSFVAVPSTGAKVGVSVTGFNPAFMTGA